MVRNATYKFVNLSMIHCFTTFRFNFIFLQNVFDMMCKTKVSVSSIGHSRHGSIDIGFFLGRELSVVQTCIQ